MTAAHDPIEPSQGASRVDEVFLRSLVTTPHVRPAFVFAHSDDSALCATAGLIAAAGAGLDVVVCAGQPPDRPAAAWDRASGFASARGAHRERQAEHARAAADVDVVPIALDLIDGQYVAAPDDMARAGRKPVPDRWSSVLGVAESHVRRFGAGALVSHRQDARHGDHRAAARIATVVGLRLRLPVVRVCDRPYERCGPACGRRRSNRSVGITIQLDAEHWEQKQQLISHHRSQLGPLAQAFGPTWDERDRLGWECFTVGPASEAHVGGGRVGHA